MFKFLRKYSVWILGFGGTLLLIAFLAPNVIQRLAQRAGYAGSVQARVGDGEKVGYDEWQRVVRESQIIDSVDILIPGVGEIESASHWFLLSREADLAGFTPPIEAVPIELQTIYNIAGNTGTSPQVVLEALAHVQGIEELVRMYQTAGRFSDRRLLQAADDLLSSITVETVVIPATSDDSMTFSNEAMQAQLDAWATTTPGAGDHGFGYQLPDRFKVEWLLIPADSIAAAARQSDGFSSREQRKFWRRNESDPTFPSVDSSPTIPEVVAEAYLAKLTEQVRGKISRRAAELLRTPKRGIDESNGYLILPELWETLRLNFEQLAASLQQEYDILLPEYGASAAWTTVQAANTLPVLGSLITVNQGVQPVPFQALVGASKEFDSNSAFRIQENVASPLMETTDGSLFVFRITATDPVRAPLDLDEVRSEVQHDLSRIARWKTLQQEANTIEQLARDGGLLSVALEFGSIVNPPQPVMLVDTGAPIGLVGLASTRQLMAQSIIQRLNAGQQIKDMMSLIPTLDKSDRSVIQTIIDNATVLPTDTPITSVPTDKRVFVIPSHENMALVLVRITGVTPASSELAAEFSKGSPGIPPILQTLLSLDELGGTANLNDAFSFDSLAARHNFEREQRSRSDDEEEEEDS